MSADDDKMWTPTVCISSHEIEELRKDVACLKAICTAYDGLVTSREDLIREVLGFLGRKKRRANAERIAEILLLIGPEKS